MAAGVKVAGAVLLVLRCDESGFTEIVFCFEVLDFGFVGSVDDADGDGEDGVALW